MINKRNEKKFWKNTVKTAAINFPKRHDILSLNLSMPELDNEGLEILCNHISHARVVNLTDTYVNDAGIAILKNIHGIEELVLKDLPISHIAVQEVAKIPTLTYLRIGGNISCKNLLLLSQSTSIQEIIASTTDVDMDSIKSLKQNLNLKELIINSKKY